jgi:biopolymer transport protein ExbD
MAGAAASNDEETIAGINVTPLVDITLVLLIIFMVTARLIASSAIPLDLPPAAKAGETQTVFTVSLDAQGTVLADGKPVDDVALRRSAAGALAGTKELRAVIQASKAASHGQVIHVLDVLREVGITRIAFGVEKKP